MPVQHFTCATSQLAVRDWDGAFGDPTLADAILDRIVHNAYKLEPSGDSVRRIIGLNGHLPTRPPDSTAERDPNGVAKAVRIGRRDTDVCVRKSAP